MALAEEISDNHQCDLQSESSYNTVYIMTHVMNQEQRFLNFYGVVPLLVNIIT